jgi:hypothetical protein
MTHTRSEIARLGDELFDRVVAPATTPDQDRLFVAIDVDSGAFEIAADELSAGRAVLARHPDAQIWLRRVGEPYLHRFSPRVRPDRGHPR